MLVSHFLKIMVVFFPHRKGPFEMVQALENGPYDLLRLREIVTELQVVVILLISTSILGFPYMGNILIKNQTWPLSLMMKCLESCRVEKSKIMVWHRI